MLKELHLKQVGPAPRLDVDLAPRLNLFTGDNGLGKTFLLDIAWWVLTGAWTDEPARPHRGNGVKPEIGYQFGGSGAAKAPVAIPYNFMEQTWPIPQARPAAPGLVIYVRVDGGFSVWDPVRNLWPRPSFSHTRLPERPDAYHFHSRDLWDGLEMGDGRVASNGLIRDWVSWQNQPDQDAVSPFALLKSVLSTLSHPEEPLRPGKPTRVSIEDVRDIPTLDLPYGNVPVTLASAGMKRILGLAYLLVWAWYEHTRASELINRPPTDRLTILADELEAHLHPRWQRAILPAILTVAEVLQPRMHTQVLATTHAPLIMASAEPVFDEKRDRAFVFRLEERQVTLEEYPWARQGDALNWLVSEVFGLDQARSREAEEAIEAAEAFMRHDPDRLPPHLHTRAQIQRALQRLLPGHDPFWPRWVVKTQHRRGSH